MTILKLHELQANFIDAKRTAQEEIKHILHERQLNWSVVHNYVWEVYEVRGLNQLNVLQLLETLAWLRDRPTIRQESTIWIMEQIRSKCKPQLKRRR